MMKKMKKKMMMMIVYDYGYDDDGCNVVCEFVRLRDLGELVDRRDRHARSWSES